MERIEQTDQFKDDQNNLSLSYINEQYRNLYDQCLSDSACNLDIYVAEHDLDKDKLDSSILDPIKYTTLREVLSQREILLNAGYKLTDFDANTFDPTESITSQITVLSSGGNQAFDYESPTVNYSGLTQEVQAALKSITSTTTIQNTANNTTDPKVPIAKPIVTEFEINKGIAVAGVAVVVGIIAALTLRKRN